MTRSTLQINALGALRLARAHVCRSSLLEAIGVHRGAPRRAEGAHRKGHSKHLRLQVNLSRRALGTSEGRGHIRKP